MIEAGNSRVTVLGTRFTVRREAGGVRVTVAVRENGTEGDTVKLVTAPMAARSG